MKYFKFLRCVFNLVGTANWYQGIDKPTLFQRYYKWRVSFRTAIKIAKLAWLTNVK